MTKKSNIRTHVNGRIEKEEACPHGDVSYFADGIYTCICGKAFTEIELDELEWDLED